MYWGCSGDLGHHPCKVSDPHPLSFISIVGQNYAKSAEKANFVILWCGKWALWKNWSIDIELMYWGCSGDLGHHPCKVSDPHPLSFISIVGQNYAKSAEKANFVILWCGKWALWKNWSIDIELMYWGCSGDLGHHPCKVSDPHPLSFISIVGQNYAKSAEKANFVILWCGKWALWKNWSIDIELMYWGCSGDLGHHPCKVSDPHPLSFISIVGQNYAKSAEKANFVILWCGKWALWKNWSIDIELMYWGCSGDLGHHPCKVSDPHPLSFISIVGQNYAKSAEKANFVILRCGKWALWKNWSIDIELMYWGCSGDLGHHPCKVSDPHPLSFISIVGQNYAKSAEKANFVILRCGKWALWKKWSIDIELMYWGCSGDLGHHPCKVSDPHPLSFISIVGQNYAKSAEKANFVILRCGKWALWKNWSIDIELMYWGCSGDLGHHPCKVSDPHPLSFISIVGQNYAKSAEKANFVILRCGKWALWKNWSIDIELMYWGCSGDLGHHPCKVSDPHPLSFISIVGQNYAKSAEKANFVILRCGKWALWKNWSIDIELMYWGCSGDLGHHPCKVSDPHPLSFISIVGQNYAKSAEKANFAILRCGKWALWKNWSIDIGLMYWVCSGDLGHHPCKVSDPHPLSFISKVGQNYAKSAEKANFAILRCGKWALWKNWYIDIELMYWGCSGDLGHHPCKVSDPHPLSFISIVGQNYAKSAEKANFVILRCGKWALWKNWSIDIELMYWGCSGDLGHHPCKVSDPHPLSFISIVGQNYAKSAEKANFVILRCGKWALWKNWSIDIELMYWGCSGDLGHHPCKVSDPHPLSFISIVGQNYAKSAEKANFAILRCGKWALWKNWSIDIGLMYWGAQGT